MDLSKTIILIITTLLLTGLGAASQADLTIFPEESSTKINSFTSYEVEVQNTGTVKDVYEIKHNYPGEISVAPNKVELEPSQSKNVNVWFNPKSTRNEGTYTFKIDAKSRADGNTYSTEGRVNVIKDYNVQLSQPSSQTVCRGETARYQVDVTNTGIQDDELALSTEFGELSQRTIKLSPGQTETVTVTASSEEEITRNFNVKASSKNVNYASDTRNLQFEAETCYQSQVDANPTTQETAAFTPAEFDITVANQGVRRDQFTLSSQKGRLETTTLDISPQSTETTTLRYTPEELGDQEIEIQATGQSQASETVTVESYNGMDSEISFDQPRTVCRDESTVYTATIENTGEATETFSFLTPEIGTVSDNQIELDPGETEDVNVGVNATGLEDGEHTVKLESQATTFEEPVSSAETTLTVENCWDLEMNVAREVESAGENMSTIYRIQLDNTGTKENTYRMTHQGPEWVDIRPRELTIPAGEQDEAYIYVGAPFEKKGEVQITAIAEGTEVRRSQTLDLVIGEEIQDAIRSTEGEGITGRFTASTTNIMDAITESSDQQRGTAAIIIGILLAMLILYRSQ